MYQDVTVLKSVTRGHFWEKVSLGVSFERAGRQGNCFVQQADFDITLKTLTSGERNTV
jgi:hypothetical protein